MARCLIVGCGYVGCELARRLVDDGHDVFGLRRSPLPDDLLDAGVQGIDADVTQPDLDLPDADVVVYLVSAPSRSPEAYTRVRVRGLKNVLAALPDAAGTDLVYASSTGVYGDHGGEWVDEETEPAPRGDRGLVLLAGEQVAQDAGGTVVRLAGLYGPGRTPKDRYLDGATVQRGFVNLLHRDDAASAMAHAAFAGDHDLYLAVDDEPVDKHDLARWLAARTGREVGRLVDDVRSPNKRCSNERLRGEGWAPSYPTFREGLDGLL